MKLEEVPQDCSSTYGGHRKLIYAVDAAGRYQPAASSGWETEAFATQLAVQELAALEATAHDRWQAGVTSPLPWLMYRYRMDEAALAQVTGLWRWRIRRHFRPAGFQRLSARVLARYADAFGMTVPGLAALQQPRQRASS